MIRAALIGVALAGAGCRNLPAGDPQRPDVLLISIDSLRRDHVGAYGYERATTPAIDRLAAGGTRFDAAKSASPWTLPAHTTMLSGLWPTAHGVVEDRTRIGAALPWLPQALQQDGWQTAGFATAIYVSHIYGFDRGFDRFEDYDISKATNLHHTVRAERVVDDVLAWGKTLDARPAFGFIHLYDVHYPYAPPPGYETRFNRAATEDDLHYRTYQYFLANPLKEARLALLRGQYDECLLAVDDQLRRLFSGWDRPVQILITADHGEEFGERGSWGHAHTLFPEALDVPLIAHGPAFPPAVRAEPVGHIDIAATVAALAGIGWTGPGVDLRQPIPARPMLAETSRFKTAKLSIEEGPMRLELDRAAQQERLYDHRTDSREKQDRAQRNPAQVAEMTARLLSLLGQPCALDAGSLRADGSLWIGAAWTPGVAGPARFGVYPPDAALSLDGVPLSRTDARVRCDGAAPAFNVDAETNRQLELLGYIQEDQEEQQDQQQDQQQENADGP